MKEGKDKELPSFWVPTMTPDAGPLKAEKPVSVHFVEIIQTMTPDTGPLWPLLVSILSGSYRP